jgi:type II secretion system protein C
MINLVLVVFLGVQIITLMLFYFTKPYGNEKPIEQQKYFFELYNLSKAIDIGYPTPTELVTKTASKEVLRYDPYTVTAIINGNNKHFIMIENGAQSDLVNKGATYKQYKLIDINKDTAIFEAYGNKVSLSVGKSGMLPCKEPGAKTVQDIKQKPLKVKVAKTYSQIDQSFLNKNTNLYDVWSNTRVNEIYKNGKIFGYMIKDISNGSLFSSIGLIQGDTLLAINNKPIPTRGVLMQIYQKIPQMQSLKITLLRQGKIKELEYEIRH